MKGGVNFRQVFGVAFWKGFCIGLGWLVGAKTMIKRKRVDLWKCLFYFRNIDVFRGCGVHLGCQKERKTECESDLDSNSVLCWFRDHFGSHFGSQNRSKIDVDFECFFGGSLGGPSESFGVSPTQVAGMGVPGKGRIGVKPLSKGMWFVGLKKDGCRIEKGLWIVGHRAL